MVDMKRRSGSSKRELEGSHASILEGDARQRARRSKLERLLVCVSHDIMERCWDIASVDRVTMASLVEAALEREIRVREKKRGEPYPCRRDRRASRATIQ